MKNNDLLVSWLPDKLVYEVVDEDVALKVLQVAEEKVNTIRLNENNGSTRENKICFRVY